MPVSEGEVFSIYIPAANFPILLPLVELLTVAQQGIISLIKTNIGTLLEVIDSIWLIVKQNLNILTSITGTLSSIILGGGSAVVEFLLNTVIRYR